MDRIEIVNGNIFQIPCTVYASHSVATPDLTAKVNGEHNAHSNKNIKHNAPVTPRGH